MGSGIVVLKYSAIQRLMPPSPPPPQQQKNMCFFFKQYTMNRLRATLWKKLEPTAVVHFIRSIQAINVAITNSIHLQTLGFVLAQEACAAQHFFTCTHRASRHASIHISESTCNCLMSLSLRIRHLLSQSISQPGGQLLSHQIHQSASLEISYTLSPDPSVSQPRDQLDTLSPDPSVSQSRDQLHFVTRSISQPA